LKTILLVDDEANMRFLLRMILESAGYEVREAVNGAAALARVEEGRPDLVVTDLMMPVMSGRELVERLRDNAQTAEIPIILVSASLEAVLKEADAIFEKPVNEDALLAAVHALTEHEAA